MNSMGNLITMLMIVGMLLTIIAMISHIQGCVNSCGGFAKIVLGPNLNDIRGSIGAQVFSVWRGQHYIRQKASSIANPNSAKQVIVRNRLALCAQRWSSTLTNTQRAEWNELAQKWGSAALENSSKGYKDLMPDLGRNMSGYNAYIRAGVSNAIIGIAQADEPNMGADIPKPPTALAITPDGPPITKLTITWVDSPDMGANDMVAMWCEVPGISHKQLLGYLALGVQTFDCAQTRGAGGAYVPLGIGVYRFQLCTYNDYGVRSFGSNIVEYNKTA